MAIFREGALTGAISGALGGVVFVSGGKSNVVRHRPPPSAASSPFLATSKALMYNLRRFWSTLTTEQQQAWNAAASDINTTNRLGQSSPMNGFQYFIMTNKKTFPATGSIFPAPTNLSPFDFAVNPAASFSAAGAYNAQFDNPVAMTSLRIVVRGWPFWRTTASKTVARLVFLEAFTSDADPVVVNVRDSWIEHFGALQAGQQIAVGITSQFSHSPFAPETVLRIIVAA